eukprot:2241702-Rhodomonas_salina.1
MTGTDAESQIEKRVFSAPLWRHWAEFEPPWAEEVSIERRGEGGGSVKEREGGRKVRRKGGWGAGNLAFQILVGNSYSVTPPAGTALCTALRTATAVFLPNTRVGLVPHL